MALVETLAERQRRDVGIPGLSLAVVHDQETIWARGFGYADPESTIRADSKTAYCVASVTKLFTAMMLMQLRDERRLSLDDSIEKFTPDIKVKSRFGDRRVASFRELASHTSGLPQEAPLDYWEDLEFPTIEELVDSLSRTEKIHAELTEIHYSNLGIALMARALEHIAGQSWEDYVLTNILIPLGMNHSGFPSTPERFAARAVGHVILKDKSVERVTEYYTKGYAPVGGLWSCVEDLASFMSFQFRDCDGPEDVLSRASVREMLTPVFLDREWKTGFGIGWMLERAENGTIAWHSGGIPGFRAYLAMIPDKKIGIVVLANAWTRLENLMDLGKYILGLFVPIVDRLKKKPEEEKMTHEWEEYRGLYRFRETADLEVHTIDGKLTLVSVGYPPSTWSTLEPVGGTEFRVRGGNDDGETAIFERDENGSIICLIIGSFPFHRAR